jgi:pimeloyl-ACP methyl ester carboxylesterase
MLQATLSLRLRPFIASPALVRELFFTPDTPTELVDDTGARLQDESYLAFLDTLVVWARPRRVRVPVLILGADRDRFLTLGEVRRIAAVYRTKAEVMTGMGHDMMLDQGWPEVADRIDTWVRELPALERRGQPGRRGCLGGFTRAKAG